MKHNKKEWLSDYKPKERRKQTDEPSAREIIRRSQEQTTELRNFLKGVAKTRRKEREPYEKALKAES